MTATALVEFEQHRQHLFAVAYRVLSSVTEAEDVVQEAWLKWEPASHGTIRSPRGWLTTVVTRLAIDRLRSANHQRETYVGPWLPEPLIASDRDDPSENVALAESLSMAFLTLLERLNPVERAAFLLREVFGVDYADVAEAVDRSETACRQIVHRAKERIDPDRPARYEADPVAEKRLLDSFLKATVAGDLTELEATLHDHVVAWSDGGAEQRAARRPIVGRDRVMTFFVGIARRGQELGVDIDFRQVRVNGDPGCVVTLDGELFMTMAFEIQPDDSGRVRVASTYSVLNPRKLDHLR